MCLILIWVCLSVCLPFVLDNNFTIMGGDEDDHSSFLQKICENDTYFAEWCRDLPKWCPMEATYVKVADEEEQEGEDGEEDES